MGEFELLRLAFSKRAMILSAIALLVATVAACSSSTSVIEDDQEPGSIAPGENQGLSETPVTGEAQVAGENQGSDENQDSGQAQLAAEARFAGEIEVPEFDADAFSKINPVPEIRALDRAADLRGEFEYYEENRIPRDAINPVYSPVFVSPDEATLSPKELVMGLEINGDARAYPVGMMRIREMVNDEVGGTPVLVTW